MPDPSDTYEPDGQDQAEVFDEENITEDGRDIATSDMQRDVFDATAADDDGDIDGAQAADDDFDPDALDEAEYEEVVMAEEDLDAPRLAPRDRADLVADTDLNTADLEAGDSSGEEDDDFGRTAREDADERSALNSRSP
jgi:hypothetical protein